MNTRTTLPNTQAPAQPAAALVLHFAHPPIGPLWPCGSAPHEPALKEIRLVPVQAVDFYRSAR